MKQVNNIQKYCSNLTSYQRWPTREVMVGDVSVGGSNPIRIQSMTTTDTMNTDETIEQSIRMIEAGCEIVRITAPSIKEAKNLALAAVVGWIAAEFFIPALMEWLEFGPYTALAIAFFIGYSGIRLLPHLEKKVFKKLDNAIDSIGEDDKK